MLALHKLPLSLIQHITCFANTPGPPSNKLKQLSHSSLFFSPPQGIPVSVQYPILFS